MRASQFRRASRLSQDRIKNRMFVLRLICKLWFRLGALRWNALALEGEFVLWVKDPALLDSLRQLVVHAPTLSTFSLGVERAIADGGKRFLGSSFTDVLALLPDPSGFIGALPVFQVGIGGSVRTFVARHSARERLPKLPEGLVHPMLILVEGRQHRGVQVVVEDRRVVGAELRAVPPSLLADALLDL